VRRTLLALFTTVVVAWPVAAFAHEEINPNLIATGRPTFFTFSAANEEKVDLVGITLAAPKGLPFGATTKEPAGWTVTKSEETLVWTGAAVKPDNFETWGFEIEGADQPGTFQYTATLKFADTKTEDVKIDITASSNGAAGASIKAVSTAKSRASTAMVLAWVALAAAIVSMLLAVLGRRSGPKTGEQDW
jgi:hypothetical protein